MSSAVRQALGRAGWDISSVERIEINEAFAAIVIVVARELGLPEEIVNVEGGAIAHGHPIGATGAVLTTRLIHSMRRDGLSRGVITLCIGGGQGIALALETLARPKASSPKLLLSHAQFAGSPAAAGRRRGGRRGACGRDRRNPFGER